MKKQSTYRYIINLENSQGTQLSIAAPNRDFAEAIIQLSDYSNQLYIVRRYDVCDVKYDEKELKRQHEIIDKNIKNGKFVIAL